MQNRSNRGPGEPVGVRVIIMDPYIKGNRDFPFDMDI